jgi:glycosyltransferase involved in cell wall biosynthesis
MSVPKPRYSLGGSFYRGFLALGHEASFFSQATYLGAWHRQTPVTRLLRAAARPATGAALNVALLAEVLARKPDVVLILKGFHILPETIAAMRRATRVIVSYQPDDLENPLNTNEAMRRSLPLWDVVFSPRTFARDEILAGGAKRFEWLPFGYDPDLSRPAPSAPLPSSDVHDAVVFVGQWAPERGTELEQLAGKLPLSVWGGGWDRVRVTSPLSPWLHRRHLLDEELRAVFTQAGVNLLLLRKGNRDRHAMRTFEIPACAGFMLAERTEDHQAFFEEGKEAVFFTGTEELQEHARRYLADPESARRIAAAGYQRVLADRSSYRDRAARIVEVVTEL